MLFWLLLLFILLLLLLSFLLSIQLSESTTTHFGLTTSFLDILLLLMIPIGQRLEGHLRQPDCHVTRCADLRHNDVIIVQTIYSSPW